MKVLILAAGRGTRISRYLSGNPKCTVDIGDGLKLIQYTVDLLHSRGIERIGLVLGYKAQVIRDVLAGKNVEFYYNPFYDVTNSIASAWFAKEFILPEASAAAGKCEIGGTGETAGKCETGGIGGPVGQQEDLLIMNGDVYLEARLLDRILEEKKSPVMFADGSRKETADYKFYYEDGILKKYGKELEGSDISGEYIGIGRFDGEFLPEFISRMDGMIGRQEHSIWWENVIYGASEERPVYVEDVAGHFWAEVDYIEDYERILEHRGVEKIVR